MLVLNIVHCHLHESCTGDTLCFQVYEWLFVFLCLICVVWIWEWNRDCFRIIQPKDSARRNFTVDLAPARLCLEFISRFMWICLVLLTEWHRNEQIVIWIFSDLNDNKQVRRDLILKIKDSLLHFIKYFISTSISRGCGLVRFLES